LRFASDTQSSSVFEIQVYARRTIGTDDYIGVLKDSIEVLFATGTTNGLFRSSDPENQFVRSTPAIVVTRNLHKNDARGNSQEVATVLEFTISSFATLDEATTARMNEAVDQANVAYEQMVSSPSALVDAVGVADDITSTVDDVLTKAVAWEPLLERIKLYTEIVDKITEVFFFLFRFIVLEARPHVRHYTNDL
jgi:hypothetical protein